MVQKFCTRGCGVMVQEDQPHLEDEACIRALEAQAEANETTAKWLRRQIERLVGKKPDAPLTLRALYEAGSSVQMRLDWLAQSGVSFSWRDDGAALVDCGGVCSALDDERMLDAWYFGFRARHSRGPLL